MADGLDVVAVGVEHERAVVVRVVDLAHAGRAVVGPARREGGRPGERGELWIRGPQVMKGYLNNPEATAETLDDEGWLHTGDVAVVDEHGRYTVVDRVKELIKYKGYQVPPAELEALLLTHDKIADVAVIAVPSERWGETVKAVVVAQPGATVTLEELQEFARARLARYKCPTSLDLVEALPRNASGKVLKKVLREPFWAQPAAAR